MSPTPPPSAPGTQLAVPGTQAPSQIELLWERYKSIAYVVLLAVAGAIVINVGWKYYAEKERDTTWSGFSGALGINALHTDPSKAAHSLTDQVAGLDGAQLKAKVDAAPEAQRPYLLLAFVNNAMAAKDWAAAEAALDELESKYPKHTLVVSSAHPVQTQDPIKSDEDEATTPKAQQPKKPDIEPPVAGSVVAQKRAQIAAAKAFATPQHFAKKEIPADAKKFKFELSGGYGSFTLALMTAESPKHCAKFLELATAQPPFWVGIAIDEIRRSPKFFKQPQELHLGFESTKDDDRTKWIDTEPSKHLVDFEKNGLSHFPGAVSARSEADGKSCADRFWITLDDAPQHDGERVVFAFVVDGLENLRRVCESPMTAQEEEQGRGKPSETIRVTAVTPVE